MNIANLWQIIEKWYSVHVPDGDPGLRMGATENQVDLAEETLGIKFPIDVRKSYMIHNGSKNALFPNGYYLLSLDEVIEEYDTWSGLFAAGDLPVTVPESEGAVRKVSWSPKWIPLTHSGGGDHDCLDLDPADGGNAGQIIEFDHEHGPRRVSAASFKEWLQLFADRLIVGKYRFDGSKLIEVKD